ncbi:hypothetical protein [Streptomyces sp. NBC_01465]|uniref:hypothetical protein n=1 Tax=Streptomyces sp. NBC_01465 TaxID=2903878 RepID=UPI002E35D705|nr:hypothetical protein [Streptomyces sp. NBC_01465]
MTDAWHLIDVFPNGQRCCPGLRITRTFALTAAHQLTKGAGHRIKARLTPNGKKIDAVVARRHLTSDLALLKLELKDENCALIGVRFDDVRHDETWRTTFEHPVTGLPLTGTVDASSILYSKSQDNMEVQAARLECDASLQESSAYVGSPIERATRHPLPVALGLLVKRPELSTAQQDKLFAITIREVIRSFGFLGLESEANGRTRHSISISELLNSRSRVR